MTNCKALDGTKMLKKKKRKKSAPNLDLNERNRAPGGKIVGNCAVAQNHKLRMNTYKYNLYHVLINALVL